MKLESLDQQRVRLGIVGFGAQGSTYGRFVAAGRIPSVEVTAVADIDSSRLKLAEELLPQARRFDSFAEMINSNSVDAVVISTPHYLHPEMAAVSLQQGIHTLVEKPVGVYAKQVEALNDVANRNPHARFAAMFNQRVNPLYQFLKEEIDSGALGELRRFTWNITNWWRPQGYFDQSDWRATWGGEGGGILVNQVPHQLDLLQWLFGLPKSVFSKVGYGLYRDIAVEDEVVAVFDYGDGVTGTVTTCTHDLVGTDRFEILLEQGKIAITDSRRVSIWRLTEPERELSRSFDKSRARQIFSGEFDAASHWEYSEHEFTSQWGDQHCQVIENFARGVLDGSPLVARGQEGIGGVRLANAIHLSSWLGREVATLGTEDEFLKLLNDRIVAEGKFGSRPS